MTQYLYTSQIKEVIFPLAKKVIPNPRKHKFFSDLRYFKTPNSESKRKTITVMTFGCPKLKNYKTCVVKGVVLRSIPDRAVQPAAAI